MSLDQSSGQECDSQLTLWVLRTFSKKGIYHIQDVEEVEILINNQINSCIDRMFTRNSKNDIYKLLLHAPSQAELGRGGGGSMQPKKTCLTDSKVQQSHLLHPGHQRCTHNTHPLWADWLEKDQLCSGWSVHDIVDKSLKSKYIARSQIQDNNRKTNRYRIKKTRAAFE